MGKVIMSGIVPQLVAPKEPGVTAAELAVGSSVYLMENGAAVEYLVVNQGKPSNSSSYDSSCDGLWIVRKTIKAQRVFDGLNNDYENSDIDAWMNGEFYATLGSAEQAAIKTVKIPYFKGAGNGNGVVTGADGLATKVFLLSGTEVGFTTSDHYMLPEIGGKINYFSDDSKRNANASWWLRAPVPTYSDSTWYVYPGGTLASTSCLTSLGIRPAMVLHSTALFDPETLILKGVA